MQTGSASIDCFGFEAVMFEITDQVADAFAARSERQFLDRVIAFLTQRFPGHTGDPEAVNALVQVATSDGRALGLRSERALAMYCLLALLLGLEVKDDPRLRDLLLESGMKEVVLVDAMGQWMKSIAMALEGN
jgi:hypothetical protein